MQDAAVTTGAELLARGDWAAARDTFAEELGTGETPDAHDGLARALWWLGLPDDAIEHRERAFVLWKAAGADTKAGGAAVWLAREHLAVHGNDAVANGWLARAERLLREVDSPERGRLELARGARSGDPPVRERAAETALRIAQRSGDADLEVAALAELGLTAIGQGRVIEGLDRLDEAMAAATSGEADMLETVAEVCCSLVAACDLAGDAGRLEQWARIVSGFLERRGDLPLLNFCTTCNAEMLAATGRYQEAERELLASAASLRATGHRSRCVDPAVKLAEVRLLQGRWEEAGALLEGREELPEATLPAADLDLARGDTALATARLLRRANLLGRDNLLAAPVLSRLVDARLAAGDAEGAAATANALSAAAEDSGHPLLVAHAEWAGARVAIARGEPVGDHLGAALDRFAKLDLPLDAGRVRLALAREVAVGDPSVALDHATKALTAFEDHGATRFADEAAAFVRDLGGPARTGPKDVGTLTQREVEVLRLLGDGLSNAEIAARLFISTKTAGHHVSNILAKLHLRSRQEAAAYAVRTLGPEPDAR
jgi:ATP/maltotriose-dependent transcriptional regulator MalT